MPYDNPVGRWLAAAVVYVTTNLGRFVGAIHESPVITIVTSAKNKSLAVILSGVSKANAVETRRANGDAVWI